MPVPANTIRVNIRATVGTSEEMVHTLHFRRVNTSVTGEPSLQEIADKVRDEWMDLLDFTSSVAVTLKSILSNQVTYKTVDAYALDTNGHAETQAQSTFTTRNVGTSAALAMPPECAIVASLRTGLPGRSKRGRLYLGGFVSSALGTGGTVTNNVQKTISEGLADFGTAMKFAVPVGTDRLNWSVLSRTLGQTNKVTQIRVGNLWDVQRRRQSALTEAFNDSSITY